MAALATMIWRIQDLLASINQGVNHKGLQSMDSIDPTGMGHDTNATEATRGVKSRMT